MIFLLPVGRHVAIVILVQLHCPTSEQLIVEHSLWLYRIQRCVRHLHAGLKHWSFLLELHNVRCNQYNKKKKKIAKHLTRMATITVVRRSFYRLGPIRDDEIWNLNFINWRTSSKMKSVLLRLINSNETYSMLYWVKSRFDAKKTLIWSILSKKKIYCVNNRT